VSTGNVERDFSPHHRIGTFRFPTDKLLYGSQFSPTPRPLQIPQTRLRRGQLSERVRKREPTQDGLALKLSSIRCWDGLDGHAIAQSIDQPEGPIMDIVVPMAPPIGRSTNRARWNISKLSSQSDKRLIVAHASSCRIHSSVERAGREISADTFLRGPSAAPRIDRHPDWRWKALSEGARKTPAGQQPPGGRA
jgi:hypothetical protein